MLYVNQCDGELLRDSTNEQLVFVITSREKCDFISRTMSRDGSCSAPTPAEHGDEANNLPRHKSSLIGCRPILIHVDG